MITHTHGFRQFRPEIADFEHECLATQPTSKDPRNAGSQRSSRSENEIVLLRHRQSYATKGKTEKSSSALDETISVGIRQIELDDVYSIHRALSSPFTKGHIQTSLPSAIAAAHHCDLVSSGNQAASHLVGADAYHPFRSRKVLMKIDDSHRAHL